MGMRSSSRISVLLVVNWKQEGNMAGFKKAQSRLRAKTQGCHVLGVFKIRVLGCRRDNIKGHKNKCIS